MTTNRPFSARSLVLSTLLGLHPPQLPARHLVALGDLFAIEEGTVRVALSRLVGNGDLTRTDGLYRLAGPHTQRQASQDLGRAEPDPTWDGRWWTLIITADRRGRAERETFRTDMTNQRFVEAREGVWMRPTNLGVPDLDGQHLLLDAVPAGPAAELAAGLWNLDAWATRGDALVEGLDAGLGELSTRDPNALPAAFARSAEAIRHLRADPLLPHELLPNSWPGPALRGRLAAFDRELGRTLQSFFATLPAEPNARR